MTRYVIHECDTCRALNASLSTRVARLGTQDIMRRSHFLGGRYENLYVTPEVLPGIETILDSARLAASLFLARTAEALRVGWWLNVMQPGEMTYAHTHDNADELLSGVYYIDVPPNSGRFVMHWGGRREEIEPRAGTFVLFAPEVLHEVTRNDSDRARISVGFNFGPAEVPA